MSFELMVNLLFPLLKNSSKDMGPYNVFPKGNERIHLTDSAMSIFGMDCKFERSFLV